MDLPTTSSGDGLVGLLTEMKTESDKVTEHVDKLLEAVKEGQFNSEKVFDRVVGIGSLLSMEDVFRVFPFWI